MSPHHTGPWWLTAREGWSRQQRQCQAAVCCQSEGLMLDRLPQTILESASLIPLPTLPQVLVRFLALVEDDRTPLKDLATLVARDPAFTARLLTIANSTPYRQEP